MKLFMKFLARWTGLEPATTGVTGRYSNQLSYHRARQLPLKHLPKNWWVMTESNRRHSACKADALPTELITRIAALRKRELNQLFLTIARALFAKVLHSLIFVCLYW